jgi:hypothetical protein
VDAAGAPAVGLLVILFFISEQPLEETLLFLRRLLLLCIRDGDLD